MLVQAPTLTVRSKGELNPERAESFVLFIVYLFLCLLVCYLSLRGQYGGGGGESAALAVLQRGNFLLQSQTLSFLSRLHRTPSAIQRQRCKPPNLVRRADSREIASPGGDRAADDRPVLAAGRASIVRLLASQSGVLLRSRGGVTALRHERDGADDNMPRPRCRIVDRPWIELVLRRPGDLEREALRGRQGGPGSVEVGRGPPPPLARPRRRAWAPR